MILKIQLLRLTKTGVPRRRGDDPYFIWLDMIELQCSPQARG